MIKLNIIKSNYLADTKLKSDKGGLKEYSTGKGLLMKIWQTNFGIKHRNQSNISEFYL